MVGPEELEPEILREKELLPRLDLVQLHRGKVVEFFELGLQQPKRKAGSVYRHLQIGNNVGNGADMILVPVRQDYGPQVVPLFQEVADVRQHNIDAVHLLLGKFEAGVKKNGIISVFEEKHVFPDIPDAAQRNHPQSAVQVFQISIYPFFIYLLDNRHFADLQQFL